jgi:hypothetical protein
MGNQIIDVFLCRRGLPRVSRFFWQMGKPGLHAAKLYPCPNFPR